MLKSTCQLGGMVLAGHLKKLARHYATSLLLRLLLLQ
jgi:hypothetical protein